MIMKLLIYSKQYQHIHLGLIVSFLFFIFSIWVMIRDMRQDHEDLNTSLLNYLPRE